MEIVFAAWDDLDDILKLDNHIPRERLRCCIQNRQVLVLKNSDRIYGMMRWSLFWQTIPFLDLIILKEQIRGRGYGRKMMSFWEEHMKSFGYQDVLLSTQADEDAQYFYKKLGYQEVGSFLPPMQDVQELIFCKKI
jgi:GNAT superfamily N-acetyltransferase